MNECLNLSLHNIRFPRPTETSSVGLNVYDFLFMFLQNYKDAVQLYSKTITVLTAHSHVLSFKNIKVSIVTTHTTLLLIQSHPISEHLTAPSFLCSVTPSLSHSPITVSGPTHNTDSSLSLITYALTHIFFFLIVCRSELKR